MKSQLLIASFSLLTTFAVACGGTEADYATDSDAVKKSGTLFQKVAVYSALDKIQKDADGGSLDLTAIQPSTEDLECHGTGHWIRCSADYALDCPENWVQHSYNTCCYYVPFTDGIDDIVAGDGDDTFVPSTPAGSTNLKGN